MVETRERLRPTTHIDMQQKVRYFICGKEGCWSTKHTPEERQKSRNQYLAYCDYSDEQPTEESFAAFLANYEGHETAHGLDDLSEDQDDEDGGAYVRDDEREAAAHLIDAAFVHSVTGLEEEEETAVPASYFTLQGRYSRTKFQGIIPDTGATEFSTAGYEQYLALNGEDPAVEIDTSRAGEALIKVGKGSLSTSLGAVTVDLSGGSNLAEENDYKEMLSRLTDVGETLVTRMCITSASLKFIDTSSRSSASVVAKPGPSLQRISASSEAVERHDVKDSTRMPQSAPVISKVSLRRTPKGPTDGSVQPSTPGSAEPGAASGASIGPVTFHVVDAPTPFLLCVQDMDRLAVFFRNTTDSINTKDQSLRLIFNVIRTTYSLTNIINDSLVVAFMA